MSLLNHKKTVLIFGLSKWDSILVYSKQLLNIFRNKKNFYVSEVILNKVSYKKNSLFLLKYFLKILIIPFVNINFFKPKKEKLCFITSFSLFSIFIALYYRLFNFTIIYFLHDYSPHSGLKLKEILTLIINNVILYFSDKIVIFSHAAEKYLIKQNYNSKKLLFCNLVSIIEPYQRRSPLNKMMQKYKNKSEKYRLEIAIYGRNCSYKGFDQLIQNAIKINSENNNSIKWTFLGVNMSDLEKYLPKNKDCLSNSIIIKSKRYSEKSLFNLLTASDLTICAYKDMTQSGILIDAMCTGLDILTLDYEFTKEIDEYPGLIRVKDLEDINRFLTSKYHGLNLERRKKSIEFYNKNFSYECSKLSFKKIIYKLTNN